MSWQDRYSKGAEEVRSGTYQGQERARADLGKLKTKAAQLAAEQSRTLSNFIRVLIEEAVRKAEAQEG